MNPTRGNNSPKCRFGIGIHWTAQTVPRSGPTKPFQNAVAAFDLNEFIDLTGNAHSRNNWARGGCQYGMMPSNGLTYMPPNACCCYPGAMLHGFYALAGPQDTSLTGPRGDALQRGPAYDGVADADADADADATATKDQ